MNGDVEDKDIVREMNGEIVATAKEMVDVSMTLTREETERRSSPERTSTSERVKFERTIEKIRSHASQTIAEVSEAAKRVALARRDRHMKELAEERKRSEEEILGYQEDLRIVNEELIAARKLLSILQSRFDAEIQESSGLSPEMIESVTGERDRARNDLATCEERLRVAKTANQDLRRELDESKREFDVMLRMRQEDAAVEGEQMESMKTTIDELESELETSRREASRLTRELKTSKLKCRGTARNVQQLKRELNDVKRALREKDSQLQDAVKRAATTVIDEVDRETAALRSTNKALKMKISQLESDVVTLSEERDERDMLRGMNDELRAAQINQIRVSEDYERQIHGLHELLAERDQQIHRLGVMLRREIAATDVETGSTPRLDDLRERVRSMQEAVGSMIESHFAQMAESANTVQTTYRQHRRSARKKHASPSTPQTMSPKELKAKLDRTFERASEIRKRHRSRVHRVTPT